MNYRDYMSTIGLRGWIQEEIAEIGLREVARRENIPSRIVEKVLDSDECPRCFRRLSRPYLTEQEVRSSTPALQRYMGELVICPTCGHYVLQRDEVTTNKENRMGQRLNPETGEPLTEMVGPNGGPYVEVPVRAGTGDGMTAPPAEHILQFFDKSVRYVGVPDAQPVLDWINETAHRIVEMIPRNPERTVALRKLLEAKDAAVRAVIAK